MQKEKEAIVNRRINSRPFNSVPTVFQICLCGLFVVALMTSGCASLGNSAPPVALPVDSSTPTYKVILAGNGKPKIFTGKLDKATTVQQALVASGATRKFKVMTIKVARRIQGSSEVLKMPSTFDSDAGSVLEETNYAIHPGDEILVKPGGSGIGDMLGLGG